MSSLKKTRNRAESMDEANTLEELAVHELKNDRLILPAIALSIFIIISIIFFLFVLPMYIGAQQTGENIGSATGTVVGRAIGSVEGFSAWQEGGDVGKEEGLNAQDTEIVAEGITNELGQLGKLEVLMATVSIKDISGIGADYKALYLLRGDAIFTIDLNHVKCVPTDNEIQIMLPPPKCSVEINDTDTEIVAQYQKDFFTGSADAGFEAAVNTIAQIKEGTQESIDGYDALMAQARVSAKQQIELLVKHLKGPNQTISVTFNDGK